MDNKINKAWGNFLNPDVMRPTLISIAIYIAGFEILKDSIIGRVKDFYSFINGVKEDDGFTNPKYKSDVLSRNQNEVFACLDWLKSENVIDENDINVFSQTKAYRNDLAHRLHQLIGTEVIAIDFEKHFREIVILLRKIETWWVINFEIPTNPDFDGKEIDESNIISGTMLSLQLMCEIALGSEEQSWSCYEEYKKVFKKST